MDRCITTYGAYVYDPSSSITAAPSSQLGGVNNYQSAPPLRHLPIPELSLECSTNAATTALTHSPSHHSYLAHGVPSRTNYQELSSTVSGFQNQNHISPIPLPPSHADTRQAPSTEAVKATQNATAEKKRWNTADFRWMFTKRNGSLGKLAIIPYIYILSKKLICIYLYVF